MYFNQRRENSGYLSDTFARAVLGAIPRLDVERAIGARDSAAVRRALRANDRLAARAGADATPMFLIGRTGRPPQVLSRQLTTAQAIGEAVDRLAPAGA
jgi:hypothetical protein